MKRILIALLFVIMIVTVSCNQMVSFVAVSTGMKMPKYKTTEKSLTYFKDKTGYDPQFIAYAKDVEAWKELVESTMFPHEEFYNAFGQKISYDSTRSCPGSAAKFVKALGNEGLHMEVIQNKSVEDLLEYLEFAPEMVFDPVELGQKYDYAMFIFFYTGMLGYNFKVINYQLDSVAANNASEVAVVPVCLDGNTTVFNSRRQYKQSFFSLDE